MSNFANKEDPDEMQHYVTFRQGLHCKGKKNLRQKNTIFLKKL